MGVILRPDMHVRCKSELRPQRPKLVDLRIDRPSLAHQALLGRVERAPEQRPAPGRAREREHQLPDDRAAESGTEQLLDLVHGDLVSGRVDTVATPGATGSEQALLLVVAQ
nr:hypothetical protein [Cellulomonas telluris]